MAEEIVDAIAPVEIAALFGLGETPRQRLRSGDETSIQLPAEEVEEFVRLNRAGREVRPGDQAHLPHMSPQPAEGVEQPRAPLAERERALEALPIFVEHALDPHEIVPLRPLHPFRWIKVENAQSQIVGAGQLERAGRSAWTFREGVKTKLRLDLLVLRLHLRDYWLRVTQPPHEQPVEVDLKPGPIRQGLDRQAGAGGPLRADIAALPGALDRGRGLRRRRHAAIPESNEENCRRGDAPARPGHATIGRALSHRNARLDPKSAGARSTSTTCRGTQGSDRPDDSLAIQGLAIGANRRSAAGGSGGARGRLGPLTPPVSTDSNSRASRPL